MKSRLTLTLALLLLCTGAALAQTPDGQTPAQETVCDNETGAAFGLCNAYCEAMDCESDAPQASATACTKVRTKYQNITGHDLPCEQPTTCPPPPPGTTCPCVDALPDFSDVLNQNVSSCSDSGLSILRETTSGSQISATCNSQAPLGGGCGVLVPPGAFDILSITPEEGSACMELIRAACISR